MERREFLVLNKHRQDTAELFCRQLFMQYLDASIEGTNAHLFTEIEQVLATVQVLHLNDAPWLACRELQFMESMLDRFRKRGGHIVDEESKAQWAGGRGQ
jgi:hypothetical protein